MVSVASLYISVFFISVWSRSSHFAQRPCPHLVTFLVLGFWTGSPVGPDRNTFSVLRDGPAAVEIGRTGA